MILRIFCGFLVVQDENYVLQSCLFLEALSEVERIETWSDESFAMSRLSWWGLFIRIFRFGRFMSNNCLRSKRQKVERLSNCLKRSHDSSHMQPIRSSAIVPGAATAFLVYITRIIKQSPLLQNLLRNLSRVRRIFSSEKWKVFLVGWSAEHCEKSNLRIVNAIQFGSHQHDTTFGKKICMWVKWGFMEDLKLRLSTNFIQLWGPQGTRHTRRHFTPSNYSQLALKNNNPTPIIFKCRFIDIWSRLSLYTRAYFCAIVRSIQEITACWPWKWQNKQQAASDALFKHNCLTDDAHAFSVISREPTHRTSSTVNALEPYSS